MNKYNMYKVCFICTGNACRSPFAECVTKKLMDKEGVKGVEIFSLGTLDWGKNPRDTVMADIAQQMGYCLTGITTHMSRDRLMDADCIIVFEEYHRNAVTKELDYSHWDRIVLFNKMAFDTNEPVEDPNCQSTAVYERVAQHIEEGCKRLVEQWKWTLRKE